MSLDPQRRGHGGIVLHSILHCSCLSLNPLPWVEEKQVSLLLPGRPMSPTNWHLPWALAIYLYKDESQLPLQLLTINTP